MPRRKPMARMASPLVSDECMAIQQFRGKAYLTRQLICTREERAQQCCALTKDRTGGRTEARLSRKRVNSPPVKKSGSEDPPLQTTGGLFSAEDARELGGSEGKAGAAAGDEIDVARDIE